MKNIKSVAEHAAELSYFVSELWQQGVIEINPASSIFPKGGGFQSVCEWLDLSKSLVSVSTNSTAYDMSSGWFMCGPAIEYADRRDNFLNQATLRISRFMFLWSSLECLLKTLWSDLPEVPKTVKRRSGLVGKGVWYITKNTNDRLLSSFEGGFDQDFPFLAKKFMLNDNKSSEIDKLFYLDEFKSKLSIGLNAVGKVRNSLAHGTHLIPEDEEYGEFKNEEYFKFLDVSSSNLLLSMQILLTIYLGRKINNDFLFEYKNFEEVSVLRSLENLHRVDIAD